MRPNKIRWFEWSDEAFRKAQAEEKPILLYLGAPWSRECRAMEETTFEDDGIAELLERDYVPVRVDTDRRPDIFERYNLDGLPTTAFLTHEGDLLGGTTDPSADRMRPLLVQLKPGYAAYKSRFAAEIVRREEAQAFDASPPGIGFVTMEIFRKTVRGILFTFDSAHGGFGISPKHPLVASLRIMLQAYYETEGPDFRQALFRTLDAMGEGGIYDAAEGGFFHGAARDNWTEPQTEKLCEVNAGLIRLYLDAWEVTGRADYRDRAVHSMEWVTRRLCDAGRGLFYGSQGADGSYYAAPPGERARLEAPPVDETVYTPSSTAMASAFLRASEVLGDPSSGELALRGLDTLVRECVRDDGVAHYHDGAAPHVFDLARALLDAYDHAGARRHLEAAEAVMMAVARRFWSEKAKGIVDRPEGTAEKGLLARPKRIMPENAAAAENFARLWRHGGDADHRAWAERLLVSCPDFMDDYGHFTAEHALAADWLVRPPTEVRAAPGTLNPFVPRRVVRR